MHDASTLKNLCTGLGIFTNSICVFLHLIGCVGRLLFFIFFAWPVIGAGGAAAES